MSILHQNATLHSLGSAATHPPRVKSIGWTILDIIKMQTDRQTFLPLLERRLCSALFPTRLQILGTDYYRSFEAQKIVFGPALVFSVRVYLVMYFTFNHVFPVSCHFTSCSYLFLMSCFSGLLSYRKIIFSHWFMSICLIKPYSQGISNKSPPPPHSHFWISRGYVAHIAIWPNTQNTIETLQLHSSRKMDKKLKVKILFFMFHVRTFFIV